MSGWVSSVEHLRYGVQSWTKQTRTLRHFFVRWVDGWIRLNPFSWVATRGTLIFFFFFREFHASSAHNVHMLHAVTQLCFHVRWSAFGCSGSFCAVTVPYVGFLSVLCLKFITASGLGNYVQRHLWRNSAGLDRERDTVCVRVLQQFELFDRRHPYYIHTTWTAVSIFDFFFV